MEEALEILKYVSIAPFVVFSVVFFISFKRSLTVKELKWKIISGSMLAIIFAIKSFLYIKLNMDATFEFFMVFVWVVNVLLSLKLQKMLKK